MGGTGFDTPHNSSWKTSIGDQGGAECGALPAPAAVLADDGHGPDDADANPLLTRFLAAWDRLSDADRLEIVSDAERRAEELGDADSPAE